MPPFNNLTRHRQELGLPRVSSRESGTVLILSILLMLVVVSFGICYAEISVLMTKQQAQNIVRAQSTSISEAGLDYARLQLASTPTLRGALGPLNLPGGFCEVAISNSAGAVEIDSKGSVSGVRTAYRSRVTVESELDVGQTISADGDVVLNGSTLSWAVALSYTGDYLELAGGSGNGARRQGTAHRSLALASTVLPGGPTHVLERNTVLTGAYEGRIQINGDATIKGPFALRGSLVVHGNLTVSGDDQAIKFLGTEGISSVTIAGDLIATQAAPLSLTGLVTVLGDTTIENSTLSARGTLLTRNLTLHHSSGEWEFMRALALEPPSGILGGNRVYRITELWRLPYDPNGSGDRDGWLNTSSSAGSPTSAGASFGTTR